MKRRRNSRGTQKKTEWRHFCCTARTEVHMIQIKLSRLGQPWLRKPTCERCKAETLQRFARTAAAVSPGPLAKANTASKSVGPPLLSRTSLFKDAWRGMEAKAPRTSSAPLPPIHALAAWSCWLMVGHLQDGNELRWSNPTTFGKKERNQRLSFFAPWCWEREYKANPCFRRSTLQVVQFVFLEARVW